MLLLKSQIFAKSAFGCSLKRLFCDSSPRLSNAINLSYTLFENRDKPRNAPPLFLLHGLFGSKKNFESIAKNLNQSVYQVISIDARNHGDSPHTSEMSYHLMSGDLEQLMKDLNIKSAIILGHSMGGKVAMTLALTKPHLVDMLIVADIAPTPSRSSQLSTFPSYIQAMKNVEFGSNIETIYQARKVADAQLIKTFPEKPLRDFILTNVAIRDGKFTWRINVDALERNLHEIVRFPVFSSQYHGKTFFIGGRNSSMISESDYPEIYRLFPKAEIQHIDGAGHWVHADKPHEFIEIVKQLLLNYEQTRSDDRNGL